FVHPLAGVLSAYGMGLADQIAMREASVEALLNDDGRGQARDALLRIAADARAEIESQGFAAEAVVLHERMHIRYEGTDTSLVVPAGSLEEMTDAFETAYRTRFAFLMPGKPLVIESVSVEAVGPGAGVTDDDLPAPPYRPAPHEHVRMYAEGQWHDAQL